LKLGPGSQYEKRKKISAGGATDRAQVVHRAGGDESSEKGIVRQI
jgi:hypothetical protein